MKIAYITNTTYVNGWANSIQIVNMCRSFSGEGAKVTLLLPYRSVQKDVDIFKYFDIPKTFNIKMLPCIDLSVGGEHPIFYWLRFISFYISARFYVWFNNFDIIYSRDIYSSIFFPNIVLEQHSFPRKINFFLNLTFTRNRKIVCLTSFIKNLFIEKGISESNILIAPSAVDLDEFNQNKNRLNISGIDSDKFVFGYIGTLKTMNMEKGVGDCLSALTFLGDDYRLLIVGGESDDLEYYKKMSEDLNVDKKVIFIGKVSYSEVSKYSFLCDVFVAPYPENEHYSFYMSPLKIFEYMASRKPVIATNLPSIKEVLTDGQNAILIKPSDPKGLSEAIVRIKENPELGKRLAEKAYEDVSSKYTWQIRAKNIISFIEKK